MRQARLQRLLGLVFLSVCSDACTGAGLEPVQGEPPPELDNRLNIRGTICTEVPKDELFPVKVIVAVDTSNSLQFTDPATQRVTAVQQLLDRYAGNPAVTFSVIAFDAIVSQLTNGFVTNPNIGRIATRLSNADRLTDYQGALGTVFNVLSTDMRTASPAARARTKYVVIFFSDGAPDPQCFQNTPPRFANVCNVPRGQWPSSFVLPPGQNPDTGDAWTWDDFQGLYPELEAGKDYNTPSQLMGKVRDILELQKVYNVNEIRFHTAFLFDPMLDQAVLDAFGLNRGESLALLQDMATEGNGTFTEFTSGGEISFLNVNYTSAKQSYALTNLIVSNHAAAPQATGAVPDSDGDGLPDHIEDELRLCGYEAGGRDCNPGTGTLRDPRDSDGDGYTDLFEYRFRASGFDPRVGDGTTARCLETDDSDGDGLIDCEEAFLGSDPRLHDTDGDRVPDGIEFRFGLDPTERDDALGDNDADGLLNVDEIIQHWSPNAKEPARSPPPAYDYIINWQGERPDGRNCYDYTVDNVRLMTTRAARAEGRGANRIWLSFLEGPPDDPRDFGAMRVACIDARFVAPDFKVPADGLIVVDESDFYAPADTAIECVVSPQ